MLGRSQEEGEEGKGGISCRDFLASWQANARYVHTVTVLVVGQKKRI